MLYLDMLISIEKLRRVQQQKKSHKNIAPLELSQINPLAEAAANNYLEHPL